MNFLQGFPVALPIIAGQEQATQQWASDMSQTKSAEFENFVQSWTGTALAVSIVSGLSPTVAVGPPQVLVFWFDFPSTGPDPAIVSRLESLTGPQGDSFANAFVRDVKTFTGIDMSTLDVIRFGGHRAISAPAHP